MDTKNQVQPLVWVHGDCLRPTNPALVAYPDAPRVFIFDTDLLLDYGISFKRIVFIYECVLAIPGIQIFKGAVVSELAQLAAHYRTREIVTVESASPRFSKYCRALRENNQFTVSILSEPPFITLDKDEDHALDLKRFSRYWNSVSRATMRLDRDET